MATNWDERFFESTRGQIVTLLRRSGRTVEELARALASQTMASAHTLPFSSATASCGSEVRYAAAVAAASLLTSTS